MLGVVVVYQYDTGTALWSPMIELTMDQTAANAYYGSSLAMIHDSGTDWLTIAVGAPGTYPGFVFVHRHLTTGTSWSNQSLTSTASMNSFGISVALYGNVLAVGENAITSSTGKASSCM